MDEMITVYLYGKKYTVPSSLTIMEAFEYSGYQLVRGCGCRNGFCGACATIYRIKGETTLHGCLACSTKVEDNMCVASLPFFPLEKEIYNIDIEGSYENIKVTTPEDMGIAELFLKKRRKM